MSSGTRRQDTCRLRQAMSAPMGSSEEARPETPSISIRYSAGLAR